MRLTGSQGKSYTFFYWRDEEQSAFTKNGYEEKDYFS